MNDFTFNIIEEYGNKELITCPKCNTSFSEYKKTGFLGCSHCYDYFKSILYPTIKKYQFVLRHEGKYPINTSVEARNRKRISTLKKDLKEAIKDENFELAAQLRDEIRSIETNFIKNKDIDEDVNIHVNIDKDVNKDDNKGSDENK